MKNLQHWLIPALKVYVIAALSPRRFSLRPNYHLSLPCLLPVHCNLVAFSAFVLKTHGRPFQLLRHRCPAVTGDEPVLCRHRCPAVVGAHCPRLRDIGSIPGSASYRGRTFPTATGLAVCVIPGRGLTGQHSCGQLYYYTGIRCSGCLLRCVVCNLIAKLAETPLEVEPEQERIVAGTTISSGRF